MAAEYDITIEQGATWKRTFTWKDGDDNPIDLTGFSAAMQIRTEPVSETPLIDLSDTDGITLGGTDGTIAVSINANRTQNLPAAILRYDLELMSSGNEITRLLEGNVYVSEQITRITS